MNIGIYGHSISMYEEADSDHFITLLKNHYNAKIVNTGVAQCSEERILFELKKTKNLDLAIIVHSAPYNIFVPSWNRDISNVDKDSFATKVELLQWLKTHNVDPSEIDDSVFWFSTVSNSALIELCKHYGVDVTEDFDAAMKYLEGDTSSLKETLIELAKKAKDDIDYYSGLFDALLLSKKYLSHPDLSRNRYYGALIQIDQYLKSMNIPCVHLLDSHDWYPKWFTFSSGPTDKVVANLQKDSNYFVGYSQSSNGLSAEGNKLIYDKIIELATSSIAGNASDVQSEDGGSNPPVAPERNSND
jgi:hypothetical protein